MDSVTHVVLGACIGEALEGKKLGRRAMLWGAAIQSLPDIDFVASFWMSTSSNLLAHRGFTHSILFAVIMAPLLALVAERIHRPHNVPLKKWILFFGIEISVHLLLDCCNAYGTGLFEPFSHARVSLNAIFVADPLFSIGPAISFIVLLLVKRRYIARRIFWWRFGVITSSLYLSYCLINKINIDRDTRFILKKQNIVYNKYFTTPTALNSWLWYIVVGDDTGFYIGYRSVFDSKKEITFHYFQKNDTLLANLSDMEDLQKLKRFSGGFYTAEKWNETIVFNDLRFGQIIGWKDPNEKFVFHYFLQRPLENELVVQRGRFAKMDMDAVSSLIKRIKGN